MNLLFLFILSSAFAQTPPPAPAVVVEPAATVQAPVPEAVEYGPADISGLHLSFREGVGTVQFAQKGAVSPAGSMPGQNLKIELDYMSESGWGVAVAYRNVSFLLTDSAHDWTTNSLMAFWRSPSDGLNFGFNLGVTQDRVPFYSVGDMASEMRVNNRTLTSVAGGPRLYYRNPDWEHILAIDVQRPISARFSDEGYAQRPALSYEVSFGSSFYFTEKVQLGLFLTSHLKNLDYTYPSAGESLVGTQKLAVTSIDMRLGVLF